MASSDLLTRRGDGFGGGAELIPGDVAGNGVDVIAPPPLIQGAPGHSGHFLKAGNHKASMQKATQAVNLLAK